MGDCHSSAVTRRPAVAHAGGVKVNAFPLHVYSLMAPLKPLRFMRSSWVPVVPCLFFSGLSPSEPLHVSERPERVRREHVVSERHESARREHVLILVACTC